MFFAVIVLFLFSFQPINSKTLQTCFYGKHKVIHTLKVDLTKDGIADVASFTAYKQSHFLFVQDGKTYRCHKLYKEKQSNLRNFLNIKGKLQENDIYLLKKRNFLYIASNKVHHPIFTWNFNKKKKKFEYIPDDFE